MLPDPRRTLPASCPAAAQREALKGAYGIAREDGRKRPDAFRGPAERCAAGRSGSAGDLMGRYHCANSHSGHVDRASFRGAAGREFI
jgi:hypothetical protein